MERTEITLESRIIPLTIRRTKLAKRISLRISPAKDRVVMTLPKRAPLTVGMKFLKSKSSWVLANIETDYLVPLSDGTTILVLGKEYTIKRMDGRGVSRMDETLSHIIVHCQPQFTARRVKDFLKKHLLEACAKPIEEFSKALGKSPKKITISTAGSRWGSCNGRGVITFNLLLIFAPQDILEYIIAHEMAHLVEMNHSPRFWKIVETLYPKAQSARNWLRKEGHKLHRYE